MTILCIGCGYKTLDRSLGPPGLPALVLSKQISVFCERERDYSESQSQCQSSSRPRTSRIEINLSKKENCDM